METRQKQGRPAKWQRKTKAIRVPEDYTEHLLAIAQQWDAGREIDISVPPPESPADIQTALSELVERYRALGAGREAQIKDIVWPPLKQPLYESCMSRKYGDIQLALTGHHTNELCAGIFSQIREADRELLLWMLLAELLEAVARPTGGSVFPPLYGQSEIESGQKLAGLKMD